ncbi:flagellar FlbD family protein [Kineosporia sp. J2-2]|uniref:Flagellar FlbD family protein n=1 Tax=Kineosporia corallincola TaxID=2835133 RepID=A0ABS5TJX8_9ACTN|nr:flagellar FlbD family protein [Kineosporia corallincola]MBT0771407.1 flagellar FlbD family protein [Kineosporia corallincola]
MIIVTRLGNGVSIAVNPDLIERAEATPDTVITLVDGHKLVVEEPLPRLVELVRAWRASVAAEAITLARFDDAAGPGSPNAADDASAADRSAHESTFGRVLRLPSREV